MPKGTKVSRCVDKVKKSKDEGAAIAICQDSTNQGYATGRKLKESIAKKAAKFMVGKQAKKLKDSKDDSWEKEEKKKGYKTPSADDTTGYDAPNDDNASDDFSDGAWNKEDAPKKYKKKLKESLLSLVEKQAAKRVNPGEGDKAGSSDSDEYVSGGRTGKTTIQGRLTGIRTKKASPSAGVRVKNYTAGPKGRLPDWTFYKQIGSVLAEKLGFSQTQMDAQKNALKPLNPKPKRAKTPSLTAGGNKTTGANAAGDEGVPVGNDANKKSQELQQQGDKDHAMYEKEDTIMNKEKNKEQLDEILGTIVKGVTRAAKKLKDTVAPKEDDPTMKRPGRRLRDAERSLETQSTQYNNAYVRKLMEMEGPTDKDLDDIKKEKPAKIPKKKYFGGETDPKKVDTKAAIASHKKGIRAAGEATKKPEELPEATGGPNTRKMTDAETQAMKNLASAGRGGEHDRTSPPPRPGAEPKRSPSGSKRSQRTKKAADDAAGVVVSHTEYHRIGRILYEVAGRKLSPVQKNLSQE